MQLAHELARRSAALRFEDLPADAVHWAKIGILDTVGVTLAGCGEPCAQIVRKVAGNGGQSVVFGAGERASALDAALVNGVAAHAHPLVGFRVFQIRRDFCAHRHRRLRGLNPFAQESSSCQGAG